MKTILVSGASGIVGYGTLKSLRQAAAGRYRLIGTSMHDGSVAPAFCDQFEKAPPTLDNGYMEWLQKTIETHNVDLVIPGIEIDMQTWSKKRDMIEAAGSKALLNNAELIRLSGDKWDFFQSIGGEKNPVAIPTRLTGEYKEIVEEFGLPFLLKPRSGFASKGIVYVENEEIFNLNKEKIGHDLMIQPIVGTKDREYTVSAFFDSRSNRCCHISLRRTLSKEGFTETACVEDIDGIETYLDSLAATLKPVGPTNFQFRTTSDGLKLLEINPRISSATSMRTKFGYNESLMAVEYFLEGTVPAQPPIRKGYAVRYTEEHVFYDSHTV